MLVPPRWRAHLLFCAFSLCCATLSASPVGIIGGYDRSGNAYSAVVSSNGKLQVLESLPTGGKINGVAINKMGTGLIGGFIQGPQSSIPYAAFVSPDGHLDVLSFSHKGSIIGVAINDQAYRLLGGVASSGKVPPDSLGVLLHSAGSSQKLELPLRGTILSVDINDRGDGIMGGYASTGVVSSDPYAVLVKHTGELTRIQLGTGGSINGVAINNTGHMLIGGSEHHGCYAAWAAPDGTLYPLSTPRTGQINGVAINQFAEGLIGGTDGFGCYAARISTRGETLQLPMPESGQIFDVAINDFGTGLVGGTDGTKSYAAFVTLDGEILRLETPDSGEIKTVAINNTGNALIGGRDANGTYASLVTASGSMILLPTPAGGGGEILSAGLMAFTQIPTSGLSGNTLAFANYINKHDPDACFYFIPSVTDGTLTDALESAIPTRNAWTVYTVDNNLFFFNQSFSRHARDLRHSRCFRCRSRDPNRKRYPEPPCSVWAEVTGQLSYQKPQHQSQGFDPMGGGVIFGVDGRATADLTFGGGAAFSRTHIHEEDDDGYSNINQEYIYIYGLWNGCGFYVDTAIWAGAFQSHNVREIHMTGFDFKSNSHIDGYQLAPHLELGYDANFSSIGLNVEPFVMFDWAANFQQPYSETGSGPFNIDQRTHFSSFLRSEGGLRLSEKIAFDDWCLVFQEKVGFVNRKPIDVGTVTATIVGAPGSGTFTVETLTTPQNVGAAEFRVILQPVNPHYPSGSFSYQGEFSTAFTSHQIAANFSWKF
ncbi:MAG: autotransporter outer membrane beta-barrel domain-containing protein [Verrucomicrobia bacterium]|nr:autotransporter outer membrane beta-barrel domain-containing protein [Verrucomicrobiota bacterium]